ncbi:MAG: putative cytoplasmic protein [Paenibacillaceae bacterium]|jgi:tetraprenyl-beta-curcumene synthase|nr:putative cytoplasmic protein [Paenibacillaceae bacterium]
MMLDKASPGALVPHNPLQLMSRIYKYVLPDVRRELAFWREKASAIPDPELRKQAIASMTSKQFHCEGGAVYAAANLPARHVLIPLIVAFQTISDYLDNLCDRSTSLDPQDFRRLHQSMLDAVDPTATPGEYYAFRSEQDDGQYLLDLVRTCQACIRQLPSYAQVVPQVRVWVGLYGDLQVFKHIRLDLREPSLLQWWDRHKADYGDVYWNEFAAATGSTLGVFALFLAATQSSLPTQTEQRIAKAYFPYVCGLHILLDYLIDQEEDRLGGDLNFCFYYDNPDSAFDRIAYVAEQARRSVEPLENASFHRMIIEGLLALYLSDPKVRNQREVRGVSRKLMKNSPLTRLFFWINSVWIRKAF